MNLRKQYEINTFKRSKFVTVYEVTRHFGGQEEGGWWFNHCLPIHSVSVPKSYHKTRNFSKLINMRDNLQKSFSHLEYGNIYESTGGAEIHVYLENYKHEFATKERPFYC
jgi:hypothetical protein